MTRNVTSKREEKKMKRMSYEDLAAHVKQDNHLRNRWDVVCYLIGYQGAVTKADWENITRLHDAGFIDY